MSEMIGVTEARENFSAIISQIHAGDAPVYLSKRGRPVVALLAASDLDRLLAATSLDSQAVKDLG